MNFQDAKAGDLILINWDEDEEEYSGSILALILNDSEVLDDIEETIRVRFLCLRIGKDYAGSPRKAGKIYQWNFDSDDLNIFTFERLS